MILNDIIYKYNYNNKCLYGKTKENNGYENDVRVYK